MTIIPVKVSRHYEILLANGILSQLGQRLESLLPAAKKIAIITDSNVWQLYQHQAEAALAGYDVISYSFPAGEASKSAAQYVKILSWLAANEVTRTDAIVALGGGVVGDMAGFAAATYLRGIPFVQVPTTLLAMVDSSVGGKTGIDLPEGKNLAGAFYQPWLVLVDPDVLNTLPAHIFSDGMAEVIKYGMLGNEYLLEMLKDPKQLNAIITICIEMKRDIVENDEFDNGERMLLNFGHTIGHAIERLSDFQVSHGQGVAVGMAIITRAAAAYGLCPAACAAKLDEALAICKLPVPAAGQLPFFQQYSVSEIYNATLQDKKRSGGSITEVVPTKLGLCQLKKMPMTELENWIEMGLKA
ncbi:MAG: 3-dehydroquinate synthase [Defluviitaleaceae bacterium]|nr:3-dehydroquinate synthase [Defluviitaleaceae bacterium]